MLLLLNVQFLYLVSSTFKIKMSNSFFNNMKMYCKKQKRPPPKKQTNRKTAVIADKTTNPESLLNIQFVIRSTEWKNNRHFSVFLILKLARLPCVNLILRTFYAVLIFCSCVFHKLDKFKKSND